MLQPQQPPPKHHSATDVVRSPAREILYRSVDLSVITERLKEHNEGAGLGPTLGRLIVGMIHELVEQFPNSTVAPRHLMAEAVREEDSQRDAARHQLEGEMAPILAAVGLKVGPIQGTWQFSGVGRNFDSRELSLHIEDATRFSEYLAALDPSSISPSQKRGLSALYLTLCQQLTRDYDLSTSDDRLLSLVSAAASMVEHYQRLDLPTKRLETYLQAIRGRYLKTYVEAEKLQLDKPLEQGDGYRLLWHRDTTPERLQSEWNKVLTVLGALGANENARPMYETARKTARHAIDTSITEVSRWNATAGATYMAQKQPFLNILATVKSRMSEF
jgi:hypothetical protein